MLRPAATVNSRECQTAFCSAEAERLALLGPVRRQVGDAREARCRELSRLPPIEDCTDDLRCEERQSRQTGQIGSTDPRRAGCLVQAGLTALQQRCPQLVRTDQHSHEGEIGLRCVWPIEQQPCIPSRSPSQEWNNEDEWRSGLGGQVRRSSIRLPRWHTKHGKQSGTLNGDADPIRSNLDPRDQSPQCCRQIGSSPASKRVCDLVCSPYQLLHTTGIRFHRLQCIEHGGAIRAESP